MRRCCNHQVERHFLAIGTSGVVYPAAELPRIAMQRDIPCVEINPEETADNLKQNGGFIPGIRPGKNTGDYLDFVLTRITCLGALYLVAVSILPELLISNYAVPFYFGGTSLLIVVTVTMDTVAQVQSHLLAHQYEGLIKKSRLRGRRG